MNSRSPGKRARTFLSIIAVVALNAGIIVPATVIAANPSASLAQCANDPAPSPNTDGCNSNANQWVNGNVGSSKAFYSEGDSLPYRLLLSNLPLSSHTVIIEWDTTKGGTHALDYITTFNRTVGNANPCLGVSPCGSPTTFPIPADPQVTGAGVTPVAGNFTLYGGTISAVSTYTYPNGSGFTGDKSARISITFTASQANPVLAWGGHIATRLDWGATNSAVAISGSPYHTRLVSLDGSGGNQDRSLSADSVVFPGFIHIVKNTSPSTTNGTFNFTASPSPLSNFSIATSGGTGTRNFDNITTFATYAVAETVPSGWALTGLSCAVASPNGGSQSTSGSTATINLKEGEQVTCTFTNTANAPALSIVKDVTESSYSSVGQVLHYSITATNTGNTTLSAVTITDTEAVLGTCTPANGSSLATGASITCAATHTVTQADIDAGAYNNTACVDDGAGGANQVCDDADVDASQTRSLSVTKEATEENYDSVGDLIHYTIVATNTGNTTLPAVTVTDSQVSDLDCTPANGSSLAPGASMNCTASHTVTQADIDGGSFYNQACVDDGASGAAQACDDVTTPSDKNPALSISKEATEEDFDSVGDVIHYSIIATNTGNTTLASVTVTDEQGSDLTCTPTNGSSLAPGESLNCTATHTVTQADIDAGSFYNQACVDDNNGADLECDDVTTPADQNPHLSITKDDDVASYDAVGDVIGYTITATNDGNLTLSSVTVTDPNASGLSCTPVNGSSLAPGESLSCTASHTVTQADLDAGSFFNAACVDDGENGATEACDDVTTPAAQNPHLAISKVATESGFDAVGDVVHYTITASNDGNVTLDGVTVTDPNATDLGCTPANGSTLAPGESLICTASHTVTQADIDAGSFYNQACVDDGTGGAAEVCDDVTTPADQSPHLLIIKVDDHAPAKFEDVGDVIHYTITATNDGNTTLASVTVTDADADNLSCTPANGSSLAPGASMTCTADHMITQADIDAGSYKNTACVDDGEGGADEACDDVTTTAKNQPTVATTDTFIPQDSIVMSDLTAGATGDLYVELRIDETCGEDPTPAYSKTWSGAISNTTPYVTVNTVAVGADATIRWCVSYSGDANNANIPLGSHGEISAIDFDPIGVLGFGGGAIPLLAWAVWSRRKREEAN
jgi:uncharacterized repeat protein (TIGR01451 family)